VQLYSDSFFADTALNQQLDELEGNIDEVAVTMEEVAPQASFSDDEEDEGSFGGEKDALRVSFSDDD
jgi:hypothetical protein